MKLLPGAVNYALASNDTRGTVAGRRSYCEDPDEFGTQFVASLDLWLIDEAFSHGCDFEDLADGFGAGLGTFGDWSAIRDSSSEAKLRMLERTMTYISQQLRIAEGQEPKP